MTKLYSGFKLRVGHRLRSCRAVFKSHRELLASVELQVESESDRAAFSVPPGRSSSQTELGPGQSTGPACTGDEAFVIVRAR